MSIRRSCTTLLLLQLLGALVLLQPGTGAATRPNVLFIAIDDLNDWVGCMKGHPQVKTPHMDRLARRGVLFSNAHVQATYCGPSRMSVMSGRLPSTTGAYGFDPTYDRQPALKGLPSLPAWFQQHGYHTIGGGKIYHQGIRQGNAGAGGFERDLGNGGHGPSPRALINWHTRIWDFGPFPDRDEEVDSYKMTQSAAAELSKAQDKPLFLGIGFRRPHVPLHAPPHWFDMYPEDKVVLPHVPDDDLGDVPAFGRDNALTDKHAAPTHVEVLQKRKWYKLVQAYLACVSFTDHCVGMLLDALDAGPNKDNTIIVLWSDHGWHLGEKQHWAKRTLWEETTRVPLIIAGPGVTTGTSTKPVMLLDLFPTLCDLAGIPARMHLEGRSLRPLLTDPQAAWDVPAITTLDPGSHSVRDERWRYIRYADGSEELYDHAADEGEFKNLAGDPQLAPVVARLRKFIPEKDAPPVPPVKSAPRKKRDTRDNA